MVQSFIIMVSKTNKANKRKKLKDRETAIVAMKVMQH